MEPKISFENLQKILESTSFYIELNFEEKTVVVNTGTIDIPETIQSVLTTEELSELTKIITNKVSEESMKIAENELIKDLANFDFENSDNQTLKNFLLQLRNKFYDTFLKNCEKYTNEIFEKVQQIFHK